MVTAEFCSNTPKELYKYILAFKQQRYIDLGFVPKKIKQKSYLQTQSETTQAFVKLQKQG